MTETNTLLERHVPPAPTGAAATLAQPALANARGVGPFILRTLREIPCNMAGLDYRSLALFRIVVGLCLLWLTYINGYEMRAFYTDEGVFPRAAVYQNPGDFLGFSLYFADGRLPFVAALFTFQAILAAMVLLGYRTRLAVIGSYVFLLSMQNRAPLLLFGQDHALRVGLFWAMFLPLGRRYSFDRLTGRTPLPTKRNYLGLASVVLIVQVCFIYMGGALMKIGPSWLVNHTAVAQALALDVYSRPLGHWLGQFENVDRYLTIATLKLELWGPLLFVMPVFSKWTRMLGILLFAGMQAGFDCCMTMGIFGLVMVTLTLPLLPPMFWEKIAEPWGRWFAKHARLTALRSTRLGTWWQGWLDQLRARNAIRTSPLSPRAATFFRWSLVLLNTATVALFGTLMFLWNLAYVPKQPWRLSPAFDTLVYSVGLNQHWNMFAPDPQSTDGWFVVAGQLRNGQLIDMMTGEPSSFEKPKWVAGSYKSQLWMAYLILFWDNAANPQVFARYTARTWNESHPLDQQVEWIEFDMMTQTIEPGPWKSDVTPTTLLVERF